MTDETPKPSQGMKPWLRVVLVLSLALNLLIVGTVVGAMFTWSNWKSHHGSRMDLSAGPMTRALSREDRRAIGKHMRDAYRKGQGARPDHRSEMRGLVADLRADPFDPVPVKDRLERRRAGFEDRMELGLALLLERLTQMQPEERAAYADRLETVLNKRHKHRRDAAPEE